VVHGFGIGHDVEQFIFVKPGGRGGGDVADVVCARAFGGEADVDEFVENVDGVLRLDFADLEVAAGGDV